MLFTSTELSGVVIVDIAGITDERGYFSRTFCADEFGRVGLPTIFPQCSLSFNRRRGTLRGLHWQGDPFPEGKLVRCTSGAILDVAVDLRPLSPTYRHWIGVELTGQNGRALYIPPGFAHGFQTLADESEVFYQISERYRPELACGVRWNDPAFDIRWPIADPIMSPRDAAYPDYMT